MLIGPAWLTIGIHTVGGVFHGVRTSKYFKFTGYLVMLLGIQILLSGSAELTLTALAMGWYIFVVATIVVGEVSLVMTSVPSDLTMKNIVARCLLRG